MSFSNNLVAPGARSSHAPHSGSDVAGLVAVIRRLAVVPTLTETTEIVTQAVRSLLKADGATFVLRDGNLCHYADEDAVTPLWKGRRFPMTACISGWCMTHNQSVAIADIYADDRIPHDAYRPTFVRSLALAPVRRGEPFAAIGAYWSRKHKASADELDLLQTIADASGLAISVAQLAPVAEARLAAAAAEARYRAVFNQAAVGVARAALDGRFLEVNERFCLITGYQASDLRDLTFAQITHPDDLARDLEQAAALAAGAIQTYSTEKRYIRRSGEPVWVNLTASLARESDGAAAYFIAIVEDISERKAAEESDRARAEEFYALADNIPILCWMAYADGHAYWCNRRWHEYTGISPDTLDGGTGEGVHDPEFLPIVRERWSRSVATGDPFEMTFPLRRYDGVFRPFLTRIVPIRGADGRITRWFASCTDVADQQQHEDHLKLLINELNHRVKNTLATVQSMAAQSLRGAVDPEDAFARLESRLLGLSAAHNILTERNWEGATLAEVVERTLAPFVMHAPERVRCAGPEVWLAPQAAVALSLAVHELATNAVKYGALSVELGRVEVFWIIAEKTLTITWREAGGPAVVQPSRKGFGSRLIERNLPRELGGSATLSFEPGGLVCRISMAMSKL
ncbi:PAS domain S-box protein [Phenylobacterium sp. LjRoot225]|uniref:PAS domain S-box protein n=1 Tax=Phenylobacterium sp. LjRoot225 TaxID=3342285 RepID=UPI003ECD581D